MNRTELYREIKSLNLQDEIKHLFGKNFTNCSTADLERAVSNARKGMEETKTCHKPAGKDDRLKKLVEVLQKKRILLKSEVDVIMN